MMRRSSLTWAATVAPLSLARVRRCALALACLLAVFAVTPVAMVNAQLLKASQVRFLQDCQRGWKQTLPGWNGSKPNCGTAFGIECDSSGMIVSISLQTQSLNGSIPAAISNLANLRNLISTSNLTGSIPKEIGNLKNLQVLSISTSMLTGSIPTEIGNLKNLQVLSLEENQLRGPIPIEIGDLVKLNRLCLQYNRLSGPIPTSIGNLGKLNHLLLQYNLLAGSIPTVISNLRELKRPDLSKNRLTGSIPTVICNLTNLQYLGLGENKLSGSIPAGIGDLIFLTYLGLQQNQLTGSMPSTIGNLENLKYLGLSVNQFTGSIPATIGSLGNLLYLGLSVNQLTGSIPAAISNLKELSKLLLHQNELEGDIPESIFTFESLRWLMLGTNKLTGPISSAIGKLSKLNRLDLQRNSLTGMIPDTIGKLSNALYLSLAYNQLHGSIPTTLDQMKRKLYCDLSHNFLTGPLVRLPMSRFDVSSNYLTGGLTTSECLSRTTSANCFTLPKSCNSTMQRPAAECEAFCNVSSSTGACSGRGMCYPNGPSLVPTCMCQPGLMQIGRTGCAVEGWNQSLSISSSILPRYTLLTKGTQRETAGSLMKQPVTLFANPLGPRAQLELAFSVNFTFSLVPQSGTTGSNGFAFVITAKSKLGKLDHDGVGYGGVGTESIAIVFDTLQSIKQSDQSGQHVGLSVNGTEESLVEVESPFTLTDSRTYTAWVDYEPGNPGSIQVFLSDLNVKPGLPLLQKELALRGVLQAGGKQQAFFFGFVASTTVSPFQKHVILSSSVQTGLLPPKSDQMDKRALGLTLSQATYAPSEASPFSRYVSAAYSLEFGKDKWNFGDSHTWDVDDLKWPVKNQEDCSACWAYAVVASVEAAYGIATKKPAPQLSVESLFAAMGLTTKEKKCTGGSPTEAFEKLVTLNGSSGLTENNDQTTRYPVHAFERAQFRGYVGLLLAVKRQPVVVHIESAISFYKYDGTFRYQDAECYTGNLNHVVLVIGYNILDDDGRSAPPFWIIRNSWGVGWGDKGHMRMYIEGGDGVCGINVLPGIYPIVKIQGDPCGSKSYKFDSDKQPTMNPCGRFECQATSNTGNTCDCNLPGVFLQPFVKAGNGHGSNTCAYVDVCGSYFKNPCSVGACMNDGKGSYSCICPPSYVESEDVYGFPTCDAANVTATTMRVSGDNWWCSDIYPLVGISLDQFTRQNMAINCNKPLVKGIVLQLNGIPTTPCTAFYYTLKGDTCSSISKQVMSTKESLAALNPGLDCKKSMEAGRSVCLERNLDFAYQVPECVQYGMLTPQATCEKLLEKADPASPGSVSVGNWVQLYRDNPGLKCKSSVPSSVSISGSNIGVQICLRAIYWSFKLARCKKGKPRAVAKSMKCSEAYRFYGGATAASIMKFNYYNGGSCAETVGTNFICLP
ncbi:hypothetical protein CLOM_g20083 [Closterium sp. NIES-68]|nr:hypothetical protein CLOM_g20083 [Closterium sp. NIES-68]GJP73988.1 hypothetical protein CLOP_g4645 [Closterium sp. NIES-67]